MPSIGRIVMIGAAGLIGAIAACGGFDAAPSTPSVDGGAADARGETGPSNPSSDAESGEDAGPPLTPFEAYGKAVLADAPIAYWRLDDGPGASVKNSANPAVAIAADAGSTALTIELGPSTGKEGPFAPAGGAIELDGMNGKRLQATGLGYLGQGPFTFEVWYRPKAAPDTKARYLLWHSAIGPDDAYGLFFQSPKGVVIERYDSDKIHQVQTGDGGVPSAGEWHHLVFVSSPLVLFIDGVSYTSEVAPFGDGIPKTGGTPFALGAQIASTPSIVGSISEVALYDHVLTLDRVLDHRDRGLAK